MPFLSPRARNSFNSSTAYAPSSSPVRVDWSDRAYFEDDALPLILEVGYLTVPHVLMSLGDGSLNRAGSIDSAGPWGSSGS